MMFIKEPTIIDYNSASINKKFPDLNLYTEYKAKIKNLINQINSLIELIENKLNRLKELTNDINNQNSSIENNPLSNIYQKSKDIIELKLKEGQSFIKIQLLDCVKQLNIFINVIEFSKPGDLIEIQQSIEQNETCLAIAFNKNNTLMISGSGENIKLWKIIDGIIEEKNLLLYGHTKLVTCLVFTNEDKYFISGGEDGEIRIWKKLQPNVWQSTKLAVFSKGVIGVLYNHSNQQIISIGKDPLIKIIEINQQKTMKIIQTLDQHESALHCICMDESETQMASSDFNKCIMIWIKERNGNWQLKQKVNQSTGDYFGRMVFINKQTIICQQWSKPISQVFCEENGQFIQQPKLEIILSNNSSEDEDLFPTIYNQNNGILIQKHGQYVYILKRQVDTQFAQIYWPIEFQDQYIYGNLTNNGNCLVIWNFRTKKIQRYSLI
ncbi:unnamed protein product [Paramecium octaurelia]|uniref:Uncharacterized protein n=1 Tax=Paramecium octaurelia TaxID=43137 RepID=A0A8S1VDT1_PAROT|nr:unnamed protein product [Paramecium octaurelia]